MLSLNPDESRVLGVLIEKATTTPEQYPLSLNAVTNGSNQKNNRDPVRAMTEDECFEALESLRAKGLVVRVDTPGSRVHKYRHNAGDLLHARTAELAILAELLMRGPQTVGELRGRASRMAPLESIEVVQGLLGAMMTREEALVKEIPPSPGSRALRYVQLLCPDLHPLDAPAAATATPTSAPAVTRGGDPTLSDRVARLEAEVAELRGSLQQLMEQLGVPRSAL
ncbi:MAG TPA: DUF480 domain-containing protein [Tepidisphaeraceae bacterium]|nr:DUF480 domain-containing protein [Tepidisphaeraceae bacterium]